MKIDWFKKERESAEVIELGLRVLRSTDTRQRPTLMMWQPKAQKPFVNAYFRTVESREEYVAKQVESLKAHQARKAQYKAERAGTPEQVEAVKVGAIFHYSWGYDQTNAQFYEITAKTGRKVTLRELAQESVPGSAGFMSEQVKPRPGVYLEREQPFEKVLKFGYKGEPSLAMPHGCCTLWRGGSTYSSWYA